MTKEKQQELIRQLEEKEKSLELQVVRMRKITSNWCLLTVISSMKKKMKFVNCIKQSKKIKQI